MKYDKEVKAAVKEFWEVRASQEANQGKKSGKTDSQGRKAVTAGKHMDGFVNLIKKSLADVGLPDAAVHIRKTGVPGHFRPTKAWDLVVVHNDQLLAALELKGQVGSFGNNFNNRVEEAIGSATDLSYMCHYRFPTNGRPWMGWLMLLEKANESSRVVRLQAKPHFGVEKIFQGTSYAQRYELFGLRLKRERIYNGVCLLWSCKEKGLEGEYEELDTTELGIKSFLESLISHLKQVADLHKAYSN